MPCSLSLAAAADLANALLTTAAETRRLAWTLREASTSYGLVRPPAMDWLGLLNPAENRTLKRYSLTPVRRVRCYPLGQFATMSFDDRLATSSDVVLGPRIRCTEPSAMLHALPGAGSGPARLSHRSGRRGCGWRCDLSVQRHRRRGQPIGSALRRVAFAAGFWVAGERDHPYVRAQPQRPSPLGVWLGQVRCPGRL